MCVYVCWSTSTCIWTTVKIWSTSTCISTTVKMNSEAKKTHRVLQKKQPSTGNHRDTLLTPATPNFNVVIGSAEHHQQKGLFFLKAAKHKIQKTTLNWGTGGGMTSVVWYFMGWLFFWRTRYDYWLVVSTPLENISQLGLLFPIYRKIKNVPNHQAD